MKLDVDSLVKPEYDLSVKAEEAFVTKSNSPGSRGLVHH